MGHGHKGSLRDESAMIARELLAAGHAPYTQESRVVSTGLVFQLAGCVQRWIFLFAWHISCSGSEAKRFLSYLCYFWCMLSNRMTLERNMSQADRIVRGVVGIWLLAMSVGAFLDRRHVVGAITGIAGLGLLSNSLTGYCGGNAVLGIDTSSDTSCALE